MQEFLERLQSVLQQFPPPHPRKPAVDLLVAVGDQQMYLQQHGLLPPEGSEGALDALQVSNQLSPKTSAFTTLYQGMLPTSTRCTFACGRSGTQHVYRVKTFKLLSQRIVSAKLSAELQTASPICYDTLSARLELCDCMPICGLVENSIKGFRQFGDDSPAPGFATCFEGICLRHNDHVQVFGPYVTEWIHSSQHALCQRCRQIEASFHAAPGDFRDIGETSTRNYLFKVIRPFSFREFRETILQLPSSLTAIQRENGILAYGRLERLKHSCCSIGKSHSAPVVEEMIDRLSREVNRYERVITYWPVFAPQLEGAACAALRDTTSAVSRQCGLAHVPREDKRLMAPGDYLMSPSYTNG